MASLQRFKLPIFIIICEVIFLILFGTLTDYTATAKPRAEDKDVSHNLVPTLYPMFQDVHVMIYIGFGFLMTFLKKYGYSATSINLLIGAFIIQWSLIVRGFIHYDIIGGEKIPLGVSDMLGADFAAAAVLISFGAVLGKTTPLQLLVMAIIEVVIMQINEWLGLDKLQAVDVGESMYIHTFGAYFGLAVARVLYNEDVEKSSKEGSIYHSDIFSMVGTVFLWIYWPSFNGGAASGDEQHRALLNTYLSLASCAVTTFAISMLVDKRGKFDMVHIQNATLAGGVAVGTTANMPIGPWGALLLGIVAAIVSTLGYKFLTPCMSSKLKLHDTCGVNNLHGMPGILAAVAGAVAAATSSWEKWGESQYELFPGMAPKMNTTDYDTRHNAQSGWEAGLGRTAAEQGGYQMAALFMSIAVAIVGGLLTGLLLKLPIFDHPKGNALFDDEKFFEVADGSPYVEGQSHNGKPATAENGEDGDGTRM